MPRPPVSHGAHPGRNHPHRVIPPGRSPQTIREMNAARPRRAPHVFAGMRLPLTAFLRMLRDPDTRGSALLVISLFLVGTAFYAIVEGWSIVDSFYFSTMTLATVGFGDLAPTSDGAKLFTVVYVLSGVGILVAFFSELARATLELRAEVLSRGSSPPAP